MEERFLKIDDKLCEVTSEIMDQPSEEQIKQVTEVIQELDAFLEENPRHAEAWNAMVFAYFCINDFEKGLLAADKALRIAPDHMEILNLKSTMLFQLGRYREVIDVCKKILEINPNKISILDDWNSAYRLANDKSLPKPPFSLKKFLFDLFIDALILGFSLLIIFAVNYYDKTHN